MKKTTVGLMAAGAVLAAGLAWAAPQRGPGMQRVFLSERMMDALELASEQRQAIDEIASEMKPRFRTLRQSARETRQQVMLANPDDPGYSLAVAEASQASASHAAELVNLAAEVKAQVYRVLTDEQKVRATELMARLQQRRQEFMENGPRFKHRRWGHRPERFEVPPEDQEAG